jgi:hypothetical protein
MRANDIDFLPLPTSIYRPKETAPTLFQNFQCEALSQLHAHRAQDRADSLGCASLAANYLPEVALLDAQLEDRNLLAFNRANVNLVGVIHEGLCDCLY